MGHDVDDLEFSKWQDNFHALYETVLYKGNSLLCRIQNDGHRLLERPYNSSAHFDNVLEVGCGSGIHMEYIRHGYNEYHFSDSNAGILDVAREKYQNVGKSHYFHLQDTRAMDFPDNYFDRVISVYMLEHISDPHKALLEWIRVIKPGGVLSIIIPTEGGIAWNLGRYLTTRRTYRRMGIDYDYIIAREHVNTCYRLVSFVRHYFQSRRESWYPFGIPTPHLNLLYAVQAIVHK
ncbi:MAG: class I SAM-dependent methyltransferase [Proteobacteria bacterium]|nr:class I SAM-dependent methyltransferase [Pseudomonadota bacterium]MBU1593914.1 class I SAM-dependent methyltransferase [Pseudomonadota bacterium]